VNGTHDTDAEPPLSVAKKVKYKFISVPRHEDILEGEETAPCILTNSVVMQEFAITMPNAHYNCLLNKLLIYIFKFMILQRPLISGLVTSKKSMHLPRVQHNMQLFARATSIWLTFSHSSSYNHLFSSAANTG
jgi:hypothetical protein